MNYRYFIELQYHGKNYRGWQIQPDAPTVQAELNEKLTILLEEEIETVGAGRTDTGVHAVHFVAHFDSTKDLEKREKQLVKKLNGFLPEDIFVLRIVKVENHHHARFDALSRTYKYFIATRKDVFRQDYSWLIHNMLDIDKMNAASVLLKEYKDFTSFSKLHTDVKTNICHIQSAIWESKNHMLVFTIRADRFLRNMVRALVGTLVQVGREKISLEQFRDIIEAKNRSDAGESAPAKGLFLYRIEYPDTLLPPFVHTFF
jgi:tRNA pseudouridine38-40 synthase